MLMSSTLSAIEEKSGRMAAKEVGIIGPTRDARLTVDGAAAAVVVILGGPLGRRRIGVDQMLGMLPRPGTLPLLRLLRTTPLNQKRHLSRGPTRSTAMAYLLFLLRQLLSFHNCRSHRC